MTDINQDVPEVTPQESQTPLTATPASEGAKLVTQKPPRPIVTYVLIGITLVVFVVQLLTTQPNGLDAPLIFLGKINEFILDGEFWRLITPVLVHGSLIHIAFNMYALFIIGSRVEPVYGHGRFLVLYLLAGFGGNVLSFVLSPNISVGASTAIFGLLAAEIALILQNRRFFGTQLRPILLNLVMVLAVNLSIGLVPGSRIDLFGHLGGLLAGFVFAMLAGPKWTLKRVEGGVSLSDTREQKDVVMASALVLVAFGVMAAIPFLTA
ncbi:MAG: rhomboid family intramembrane serine protease [Anaerolineaceae bacterium]